MTRALIAGNWKMNLDKAQSVALAKELAEEAGKFLKATLLVCPPSVYLTSVAEALAGSEVKLGAQNVYFEASGAFTGEISTGMLQDVGCEYVILGHSERRHVLNESDQDVCKKTHVALNAGLTPIVCVGELLSERESGDTGKVIREQIEGSLADITAEQAKKLVIAYEPVWAIGTGKVASTEQAEEVHADLRKILTDRYNAETAATIPILYGGSVKPDNAGPLLAQPNIDGVLVGGASLKAADFLAIAAGA